MKTALYIAAAFQVLFLCLALPLLIARRLRSDKREKIRQEQQERLAKTITEALSGQVTISDLAKAVDQESFDTVALLIQRFAASTPPKEWEELVDPLRSTRWFRLLVEKYYPSRRWWKRLIAARAFASIGTQDDVEIAKALITDKHPAVRLAAIAIIKRLTDTQLLEDALVQAINARRVVRQYMFDNLISVGKPLSNVLQKRIAQPSSLFELRDLIRLAGALEDPLLIPGLLQFADHEDSGIRAELARALGRKSAAGHVSELRTLLRDPAWEVRTRAATSLGLTGNDQCVHDLEAVLTDGNWWVRLRAAIALRLLGAAGSKILEDASGSSDRYASEMATYALQLTDDAVKSYSS